MRLEPVEYHARRNDGLEETIIHYKCIPTTRKEKIKDKIDNLIGEIIHIFVILSAPIILLCVCINDKRSKKSNKKERIKD